jgi:simple sugar transport system permease protein
MRVEDLVVTLLIPTVNFSIPLMLASIGEVSLERAGIINVGLEGVMLISAFVSAVSTLIFNSLIIGMFLSIIISVLLASFFSLLVLKLNADQILVGLGMFILAEGITVIGLYAIWGAPYMPSPVSYTIPSITITPQESLSYFTFLALALGFLLYFIIFKTKIGLLIRAIGEDPEVAYSTGMPVSRIQFLLIILNFTLGSLAGSFISVGINSRFVPGMTAGDGFIALAITAFSNWNPLIALGGSILFGFTLDLPLWLPITFGISYPYQFSDMLPYIVMIAVLAGVIKKVKPPKSLGKTFKKD